MTVRHVVQAAAISVVAVFLVAASASAATVTFNTNAAGTGYNGTSSLVLNGSFGAAATLTFGPEVSVTGGVPSNVNYGTFTLVCATCSTQALGGGAVFNAFTFNLLITDTTDTATGRFVGTSTGGSVWSDVSQISITWAPATLGPGAANALSGNFGPTIFGSPNLTLIVAPNSGSPKGQTTVQGTVSSNAVPEPATLGLIGGGLIGLGLLRRKSR